jgi:hypothetical protein
MCWSIVIVVENDNVAAQKRTLNCSPVDRVRVRGAVVGPGNYPLDVNIRGTVIGMKNRAKTVPGVIHGDRHPKGAKSPLTSARVTNAEVKTVAFEVVSIDNESPRVGGMGAIG